MFVEEGELKLHSTQFVVLDEVDILLGDASLFAEQASTSDISTLCLHIALNALAAAMHACAGLTQYLPQGRFWATSRT